VDVVVIGSGPGGAVTSATLAEHGREVLILEDGANWPLESCVPFTIDEMRQKYRCGGLNPALGKPAVAFVEGRCVGGGSEINSALYHRTPPEILDSWSRDYQLKHCSLSDMEPHFSACEDAVSVCRVPGGTTPLASRKLAEGAQHLGWRFMEVPRWFRYDGNAGPDGCPTGTRQSMTKTFIPRALEAGARLEANTKVARIEKTSGGWKVHYRRSADSGFIRAKNVFVCAGATQTPTILRRSGFTENIGNSLSMHPTVKMVAQFPEEINYEELGVPVHQVKEFSPRISFGCSISSPSYLALAMSDHPDYEGEVPRHWRNMAIYYAMITGPTVGNVRPVPFCDDPLIRYNIGATWLRLCGVLASCFSPPAQNTCTRRSGERQESHRLRTSFQFRLPSHLIGQG
jgi:hypothetical protein